jgi:nucleoid-associated protein EbfC
MKDMMNVMKQAQAMQAKMVAMQEELATLIVEGVSGGGMVRINMTAKGDMQAIHIDPSLLNMDEKDILEDLILAAARDARTKAERLMQERMASLTQGLPLPPGLKLF